jgi:hypothetical protein
MPQRVKGKSMDPHSVSNQVWELRYVATKFKTTIEIVKKVKKLVGRSRKKIYNYLRTMKK